MFGLPIPCNDDSRHFSEWLVFDFNSSNLNFFDFNSSNLNFLVPVKLYLEPYHVD